MNALHNYYGTDIQQLNFGNANVAANMINAWVREHTRNNIKSIIQPGIYEILLKIAGEKPKQRISNF